MCLTYTVQVQVTQGVDRHMSTPKNLLADPECIPVWEPPGPYLTRDGTEGNSIHFTAFLPVKESPPTGDVRWMLLVTPPLEGFSDRTYHIDCGLFSVKTGWSVGYHSPQIESFSLEEAQRLAVRYATTGSFT
jgi:hypothetical protein